MASGGGEEMAIWEEVRERRDENKWIRDLVFLETMLGGKAVQGPTTILESSQSLALARLVYLPT
jgi:hypothetical protein